KSNNNGSLLLSDNLASYSVPIHLLDMLYVNSLLDFLQKAIQHEFNADFAHGKLETQHLKSQKTVVSNFKGLDEMKVKIEDTIKLCNVL
ncbi:MAG: hypothetical protein Q8R57_13760, partial [Bacteroidota bacterium]|nr:hypothetical protein [Bacteroidota bacterium]